MARTKKKKAQSGKAPPKERAPYLDIHHTTRKTIWGIGLFLAAALLVLSYFGQAGLVGYYVYETLDFLLGVGFFILILLVALVAAVFFVSKRPRLQFSVAIGGAALLLGILGLIDLFAHEERTAGIIGAAVTYPLIMLFSFWASFIILIALSLIALAIIFNISIEQLLRRKEEKEEARDVMVRQSPPLPQSIAAPLAPAPEGPKVVLKKPKDVAEKPLLDSVLLAKSRTAKDYALPSLELLEAGSGKPSSGDISTYANIIKRTLENFGIPVEMGEINVGPTVTQYTLKPAEGVKLSKITALASDLALSLAVHSVRIEAPIPGRSLVGVEIPNRAVSVVRLRDLLASDAFGNSPSLLSIPLGKDVAGNPVVADLSRMPHLLVAGATGSGKSVAIHSILISFLYRNYPNTVRFLIIDPKRVELSMYEDIPHLLTPVVVEPLHAVNALRFAVKEMERRYQTLAKERCRDIVGYNNHVMKEERANELMPYMVVVVDELADLMMAYPREVEASIVRLAQMARSVGIHLIISTQRPSVEVITGLIKANITTRIAFQVASQIDSRTILDFAGAEKLLGNGDMLFVSSESPKPRRLQGGFVSDKEIKRVMKYLQEASWSTDIDEAAITFEQNQINIPTHDGATSGDDELFEEAKRLVVSTQKASASFLQRRLKVGYARAARLLDLLEEAHIIGPGEGAKPRNVFVKNGTGSAALEESSPEDNNEAL